MKKLFLNRGEFFHRGIPESKLLGVKTGNIPLERYGLEIKRGIPNLLVPY
jgi:hypothetical protein